MSAAFYMHATSGSARNQPSSVWIATGSGPIELRGATCSQLNSSIPCATTARVLPRFLRRPERRVCLWAPHCYARNNPKFTHE